MHRHDVVYLHLRQTTRRPYLLACLTCSIPSLRRISRPADQSMKKGRMEWYLTRCCLRYYCSSPELPPEVQKSRHTSDHACFPPHCQFNNVNIIISEADQYRDRSAEAGPLEKRSGILGSLLRLMQGAAQTQSRDTAGQLLWVICDSNGKLHRR